MEYTNVQDNFQSRLKSVRFWCGILHLLFVALLVLTGIWLNPQNEYRSKVLAQEENQNLLRDRQQLLELLDRLARYQNYYKELHGRYTSDISMLRVPETLSKSSISEVRRHYEISVLEANANHFLVIGMGVDRDDRVTVDENYRINANFVLPQLSKYSLVAEQNRPLFDGISEQLKRHLASELVSEKFTVEDISEYLNLSRAAQIIYKKEFSHYATRWDELERVINYPFQEKQKKAKNIRFHPIELNEDTGFRLVLEGIGGALVGEQFILEQSGEIRQLRYTDALVHQVQESTKILESTFKFQISADPGDNQKENIENKKLGPVKSTNRL